METGGTLVYRLLALKVWYFGYKKRTGALGLMSALVLRIAGM
jgi:hypothetical protein